MAAAERPGRSRVIGLATGVCLAVALWMLFRELGVLALFGAGTYRMTGWAALAGAVLGLLGLTGILWGLLGLSVAVLLVVAWTPVIEGPVGALIRRDPLPREGVSEVLVLSGNVTGDGLLGATALDRLLSGFTLAATTGARHLVISRVRTVIRGDTVYSDADARELARRFAPGLTIDSLGLVGSTRDEALAMAALVRREGWRQVLVVTSPLHTRRACATLEGAGVTVICRPAAQRQYSLERLSTPGDRLGAFRDWVYEVIALRVYRWRGWLRK